MICGAMQLQAMRVSALPVVDVAAYEYSKHKAVGYVVMVTADFGSQKEEEERGEVEGKKRIFSWWTDTE